MSLKPFSGVDQHGGGQKRLVFGADDEGSLLLFFQVGEFIANKSSTHEAALAALDMNVRIYWFRFFVEHFKFKPIEHSWQNRHGCKLLKWAIIHIGGQAKLKAKEVRSGAGNVDISNGDIHVSGKNLDEDFPLWLEFMSQSRSRKSQGGQKAHNEWEEFTNHRIKREPIEKTSLMGTTAPVFKD